MEGGGGGVKNLKYTAWESSKKFAASRIKQQSVLAELAARYLADCEANTSIPALTRSRVCTGSAPSLTNATLVMPLVRYLLVSTNCCRARCERSPFRQRPGRKRSRKLVFGRSQTCPVASAGFIPASLCVCVSPRVD